MHTPAVRFIAGKGSKAKVGRLQLLCHVKPGVHAKREGVGEVTDDHIQVRVAAQAKEGEANKAVREVIAGVLRVAKSDVEIIKGLKSREKTVVISNITATRTPEQEVERIRVMLQEGVVTG